MHRKALLEKLDAYEPGDGHEAQMAGALRQFVAAHVDCFERSLAIGHVTGSAWVIDRERASVLLTHHRKLDKWLQPGGHADGDPDILRVALREVCEECGLETIRAVSEGIFDIDIHAIPARGSEREHLHYDVRFLVEADRNAPLALSEESRSLAWVAVEGIARLNPEESMARMVAKTRAARKAKSPVPSGC
jgi:8-oxo-dGTP pyrophosphatase MutT (NUDIX family)